MSGTTSADIKYLRSVPGILKICSLATAGRWHSTSASKLTRNLLYPPPLAAPAIYLILRFDLLQLAGFIGFICILFGALTVRLRNFRGLFYISVASLGIICTASMLVARIYQLWKYKFYHHDVVKYELYLHACLTAAYFIASASALTLDVIAYSMAAFFGFLAAVFYAIDCYLCYKRSRQRDAVTQT